MMAHDLARARVGRPRSRGKDPLPSPRGRRSRVFDRQGIREPGGPESLGDVRLVLRASARQVRVRAEFTDYALFFKKSDDPSDLLQGIASVLGRTNMSEPSVSPA